jgi:hypothetical protein
MRFFEPAGILASRTQNNQPVWNNGLSNGIINNGLSIKIA